MTEQEMRLLVPQRLTELEAEQGIRVLLAVEAGSRARGIASPVSDFDVRFLYVRPKEDYLRLEGIRDVVEQPVDDTWDLAGWDISKTLRLLHSGNTQIWEWLHSPTVYWDRDFRERFLDLMEGQFSRRTMAAYYLNVTRAHLKRAQGDSIKVKLYLYIAQYLMAAKYVLDQGRFPPMDFRQLVTPLPEPFHSEVLQLLRQKLEHPEEPLTDRREDLLVYLEQETETAEQQLRQLPREVARGWEELNSFFLELLE